MNASEPPIMARLKNTGIPVYRVTKDSNNPARINMGTSPIIIFVPSLLARKKD